MLWTTALWIVTAIVAIFVMARGCGGMMGGTRGGCGMPRRRRESSHENQSGTDESNPRKAAQKMTR